MITQKMPYKKLHIIITLRKSFKTSSWASVKHVGSHLYTTKALITSN